MSSKAKRKTDQKKRYSAPRFAVLTPDQAKSQLTERALPGEGTTEQLLRAASQLAPGRGGKRNSGPDDTGSP